MSAYIVELIDIQDRQKYQEYAEAWNLRSFRDDYGGELLAISEEPEVIEGEWSGRFVIMGFPDTEKARAWYDSPEYHDVREIRWACSTDNMTLHRGFDLAAALAARGAAPAAGAAAIDPQASATRAGKGTPPVYMVVLVDITDPVNYERYDQAWDFQSFMADYDGEFVVISNAREAQVIEGEWNSRLVIMRFPDAEKAHGWYESAAYHDVRKIRWASATTNMALHPGFDLEAALAATAEPAQ